MIELDKCRLGGNGAMSTIKVVYTIHYEYTEQLHGCVSVRLQMWLADNVVHTQIMESGEQLPPRLLRGVGDEAKGKSRTSQPTQSTQPLNKHSSTKNVWNQTINILAQYHIGQHDGTEGRRSFVN